MTELEIMGNNAKSASKKLINSGNKRNIALKNIPDMIIIDEETLDVDIIELCRSIRENEDNSITPIVVISSEWEKEHRIKILEQSIEYFILKPDIIFIFTDCWNCCFYLYSSISVNIGYFYSS